MPKNNDIPAWQTEGYGHIWLPYTQMQTALPPLPVEHTEGCKIHLTDGRVLVDGTSSWWSAAHGYNNTYLIEAAKDQLDKMPHVMFGGLANEPAYVLAKRLCELAPKSDVEEDNLSRVFFADSGSVATEIAMKIALQYWRNKGVRNKDRFICMTDGYHGDTLGAMSVSDPQNSLHKAFKNAVPKHYTIDIPSGEYGFAEFDETLSAISSQVAALFVEPLVQGAGGMKFHSADTLAEIHRICKKHNILFIADEIATGFYRTGNIFACNEAGVVPDILCLGKALTGGMITLAATMVNEKIYAAFLGDDNSTALMHGPTYMASPLSCAIANASLDLFERGDYFNKVMKIEQQLTDDLEPLKELSGVVDVRVRGAIGVVQLAKDHIDVMDLRQQFIAEDCWVRPFGDVVYIMPPLVISESDLNQLTSAIFKVVTNWSKQVRNKLNYLFRV